MHIKLSAHAEKRRRTRHIHLKQIYAVLTHGIAQWARGGVYKVTHNGLRVVVTTDGLVLTVYRVKSAQKQRKRRRTHAATRIYGAAKAFHLVAP